MTHKQLFIALSLITAPLYAREIRMPRGLGDATKKEPKKIKSGAKRRHITLSNMTFEELKKAVDPLKKNKNWEMACKYLERMITLCDNVSEKAELIIELANTLYTLEQFDDAAKRYQEFTQLYPGNKLVEFASYRAVICASKKILSADRDQTPTEQTLALADTFLKRGDIFTNYKKEVEIIKQHCEQTLAQSECNVASFYMKQGSYASAQKRVEHVRTAWLSKVPEIGTTLAKLEVDLGAVYETFKVPEQSLTVVQASKPVKKANDMTRRF